MNQPPDREHALPLLIIALLAGIGCLIYEMVWFRYLHLVLGISVHAVTLVLATFMVGLAMGAWQIGRMLDRVRDPNKLMLVLECGLGLYILASPLLYRMLASIDGSVLSQLLGIVLLLIPTFLMGGTLPGYLKLVAHKVPNIGINLALIYGINTLGGAIGAMFAGFWLIPSIGLSRTLYLAGSLNFVIAGIIATLRRGSHERTATLPAGGKMILPSETILPSEARRCIFVFSISGFTCLAYEVYWTRLLSYFFRDSIYDLTLVLAAFLVGIGVGGMLSAMIVRTRLNLPKRLGWIQILIGFSTLLGWMLIARFPYLLNDLQTNTSLVKQYGDKFWIVGIAIRFGYCFLLMFIPTFLFGATFPLVGRIVADNLEAVAGRIGRVSGWNTLASAGGAVLAGFVFIPLFGTRNSIILTALLNIFAGAYLLRSLATRVSIAIIAVLLTAILPNWDTLRMSSAFIAPVQNRPIQQILSLLYYSENAHGLTSVVEVRELARKYLITNRLYMQNNSDLLGLEDHRRLGQLPMLLHPNPQHIAVVGLGAGITLRGVTAHPAAQIDVVEMNPSVIEAAKQFAAENNAAPDRPNVKLNAVDARHFFRQSRQAYDLILLDIFFPMSSGSSTIFSREYYELCRRRLAPGGMLCQWLPAHQLTLPQIRSITATIRSVFPHTSLWYGLIGDTTAAIGIVASDSPPELDYSALSARMNDPAIAAELREINLQTPELLLSHFVMNDSALEEFCAGAVIDTDDRPLIEFGAPKISESSGQLGMSNLLAISAGAQSPEAMIRNLPNDNRLSNDRAGKAAIINGFRLALHGAYDERLNAYRLALRGDPQNVDLNYIVKEMSAP
jgi:spermidine synthase